MLIHPGDKEMTKQMFVLNQVELFNAGNIGGEEFEQSIFPTKEDLEQEGAKVKTETPIGRGYGLTSLHLLQVELDDNNVVTKLELNRLYDDWKPDTKKLEGKWIPVEAWNMQKGLFPAIGYEKDPEATYIPAIKVGEPLTYQKVGD